jgi:hypothetical protein
MGNAIQSLLEFDKKIYFLFICLFTFLLLYIKKSFIESEIAAFEILDQKGEMGLFNLISALQYLSIPIIYLWKFTITAFVIWIGCFMFGYKITYSQLWGMVLVGETVFLIPEILKLTWFFIFVGDPDYFDLRAFTPFSLLQLFDYKAVAGKWIYPLKALNIFEIIYWFLLIDALHVLAKKKIQVARYIIFSSYVLFFFIWLGYYVLVYK